MIFRIFKVFSQDRLIPTLQTVSTILHGSFGSPSHKPSNNFSHILQNQRNLGVNSWDPMSESEFSNIFAPDFKEFSTQLLIKILESTLTERQSLNRRKAEISLKALKENDKDVLTRFDLTCSSNFPKPPLALNQ
jgi:hypothetical protein